MGAPLSVSGRLSQAEVKRATRLVRGTTLGPTTLYYAGVTAPVISASMSVVVRNAAEKAGLPTYWQWLTAALVAALAGIAWYLIFMRLSARRAPGREAELSHVTVVDLEEEGLRISREGITTHVAWPHVERLERDQGVSVICLRGADMVIVPDAWFGDNQDARLAFQAAIAQRIRAHGS